MGAVALHACTAQDVTASASSLSSGKKVGKQTQIEVTISCAPTHVPVALPDADQHPTWLDLNTAQQGSVKGVKLEPGMRVTVEGIKSDRLRKLKGASATILEQVEPGLWNVMLDTANESGRRQVATRLRDTFLVPVVALDGDVLFDKHYKILVAGRTYWDKENCVGNDIFAAQPSKRCFARQDTFAVEVIAKPRGGPALQRFYGPQSLRGAASQLQLDVLKNLPHASKCFEDFARNEAELCEDFVCFYHSYTYAALLYEVHAAIASVVYDYDAGLAPLPRLQSWKFQKTCDATSLKARFAKEFSKGKNDHEQEYRDLAISVMCSLVSTGPEISTPTIFTSGYKQSDDRVDFRSYLEKDLLEPLFSESVKATNSKPDAVGSRWSFRRNSGSQRMCTSGKEEAKQLADRIIELADFHGMDVSKYGTTNHARSKTGYMMQLFVRRDVVDQLCYASEPWSEASSDREPLSKWMGEDNDMSWGQARVLAHPKYFMQQDFVRLFIACASPTLHRGRQVFQAELTSLFRESLSERKAAAREMLEQGLAPGVAK